MSQSERKWCNKCGFQPCSCFKVPAEHDCRLVYDESVLARKWGVHCDTCGKAIGACTSQQDAEDVLANHQRWAKVKAEVMGK
jgi:hypothetical protein